MKHIVIGTAGHVDHGKTMLTKALTGKDTDTLAEEKKRGITIENGYARFELPSGQSAGVIDVPGHERFVKSMIAGACGIDLVLLVIAADEGVMPQTREHMDVLKVLGVENGIVVFTKCDLVSEEKKKETAQKAADYLKDTFLKDAPTVFVSALTGEGIDRLKQLIADMVQTAAERRRDVPFSMPVDRVFTISGHGTVITGTLTGGVVRCGDEGMIYTSERHVRIRSLESHGEALPVVYAGMRTAMNISGARKDVKRGDIIAQAGSMTVTELIDAELFLLPSSPYSLPHNSLVHFHHGSAQYTVKVRLLECDELQPGERTLAQLVFARPAAVRNADKFVIRFFSPVITIGGGTILDASAIRHKRNRPVILDRLRQLGDVSAAQRILQRIYDANTVFVSAQELAQALNMPVSETAAILEDLCEQKLLIAFDAGTYVSVDKAEKILERIGEYLKRYHAENPLKDGVNAGEFRRLLDAGSKADADRLMRYYAAEKKIRIVNSSVALYDFQVRFTKEQQRMKDRLISFYTTRGFEAPDTKVLEEKFRDDPQLLRQVSARMRSSGELVVLTPGACVLKKFHDRALEKLYEMDREGEIITIASFKERLGVSRKYAQMYLEYWDRTAVTRRVGDAHTLRRNREQKTIQREERQNENNCERHRRCLPHSCSEGKKGNRGAEGRRKRGGSGRQ